MVKTSGFKSIPNEKYMFPNGNISYIEKYVNYRQLNYALDVLANAVICGEFGNGDERKRKLGYLYPPVQARVNQIMNKKSNKSSFNGCLVHGCW